MSPEMQGLVFFGVVIGAAVLVIPLAFLVSWMDERDKRKLGGVR